MSSIVHRRHQITVFCLVSGLGAFLLGIADISLFAGVNLAQTSIDLPELQESGVNQQQPLPTEPSPRPTPTFEKFEIPPRGYSPKPFEEETSKQFSVYHLDLGDSLSVSVKDFPEFNFSGALDPDGNILVPILGRIPVVGLTLDEVEAKIRYELGRRYLKQEPEVIASLAGIRPVQLTVLGEVVRPGFYSLGAGSSLTGVLLAAGGGSPNADLRAIIIRRPLLDGTVLEEKIDLYTPLIKGVSLPDVPLRGGDTVIVSRLEVGKDKDYDRYFISRTTLTQQSITVRVLVPVEPSGVALRNLQLPSSSTLLDALASLPPEDGLRIRNEIALMRFDPERGGVVTQELDRSAAIKDGNIAQNVPLQDEDVIIVSRTLFGKILSAFRVLTQPIRDLSGFTNFFRGNRFGF